MPCALTPPVQRESDTAMQERTPMVDWLEGYEDDEGRLVAACNKSPCLEHYSGHTKDSDGYVDVCRISEDRWRVIVHMDEHGEWKPDGKGNYTAECIGEIRYERWANGLWPDVQPIAEKRFGGLIAIDRKSAKTAIDNLRHKPIE